MSLQTRLSAWPRTQRTLQTRLLTDASELAAQDILEQSNNAGAFLPIALESCTLTH